MSKINRRQWIQKNAIAAALLAIGCRTNFDLANESQPVQPDTNDPILLNWEKIIFGWVYF